MTFQGCEVETDTGQKAQRSFAQELKDHRQTT